MEHELLRERLARLISASIYAYGSSEWSAGNFSAQTDGLDWNAVFNYIKMPVPIKFTTHFTKAAVLKHTHPCFELMYMFAGGITHHFDNQEIHLREGDLLLIPPGMYHTVDPCEEGDIAVNIMIEQSFLSPDFLMLLSSCTQLMQFFSAYTKETLHLHCGDNTEPKRIADQLISEFLNPDIASTNMIKCYLAALLISLFRVYGDNDGRVYASGGRGDISYMLSYIENNCATVTLSDTASRFGYDRFYLSKLIKQHLGSSFVELKNHFCIEQAKYQLRTTSSSVREISEKVGFNNVSHFYRIFNAQCHHSPAEYRALCSQAVYEPDKISP